MAEANFITGIHYAASARSKHCVGVYDIHNWNKPLSSGYSFALNIVGFILCIFAAVATFLFKE